MKRRCPMKKRIPALLLALCLLSVPTQAAEDSSGNFVRSKQYKNQFSDLTPDSVFYSNVSALYEYGLSVGKTDGTFGLQDHLTVGQMVIFAGRIRSLYRTGDAELGAAAYLKEGPRSLPAYVPYKLYLQAEGVLGAELDGAYETPATRAQVAHLLSRALPDGALPLVNDELVTEGYATRRFITDVTEYTDYFEDILFLYRTGLSMGSDAAGSFLPDQPITRGAAAAMLTRMADPTLRVTLTWDLTPEYVSAEGTTLGDLVAPGASVAAPATEEEMDTAIRHMLSAGQNTLTLRYDGISAAAARKVMELSLSTVKRYCEQCYNTVSCTYTADGTVTLTFSAASAGDELESYRRETMAAAIAVHDQLWEEGYLTADMTEQEKALVYYQWVCENCVYDFDATDTSLSHIPYSLFINGTAVCDGYTGAYNLLLKLEGIQCTTLSNDEHIWTVATLDGTQVHIDTTWGDSGSDISYAYFAMTPSQSWKQHPW